MNEKSVLDVMSYLDIRQFLSDYYEVRKQQNPKFSYQGWADELKLTSKSYLRFVVFGKRKVSEDLIQKFCSTMGLEGDAREYFLLLVLYSQSTEPAQKQLLGRKMLQLVRSSSQHVDVPASTQLLSHPLNLAVRNMLSFSDIPRTPEFLARVFALPVASILKILKSLESLDLIDQCSGEWKSKDDFVRVSPTDRSSILNYHRLSLLQAIEAQKRPASERSYLSLNLALSAEDYGRYLEKLEVFKREIISAYNDSSLLSKKIYQLNFNIIPVTETIEQLSL